MEENNNPNNQNQPPVTPTEPMAPTEVINASVEPMETTGPVSEIPAEPLMSTEPMTPVVDTTPQPAPIIAPVVQKSGRHINKIIIAVVAVVLLATIGYVVYGYVNQSNKTTNNQTNNKTQEPTIEVKEINTNVKAATTVLTDNLTSESSLVNTDDNDIADDINTATDNVGASVDENNF
ncbi:MAG: hypothetical protein WA087_04030 [Candidatus Saccharimonadales bacterium]